ncbi:MAG: hypothetical protein C0408_03555 [Odoribacter sp.]|nr:hypothetical protein [Odoribacter sp.]
MKPAEVKDLIINSLLADEKSGDTFRRLEEAGVNYSFSEGFRDKVLDRIFSTVVIVNREMEFIRSMNIIFYRIALTGVAAIVLLLISIFMLEGSISFNSFLGLSDNYDESIVCLLTGN